MASVQNPPPLLYHREAKPQPLWPVILAVVTLTASSAAMILVTFGFEDTRPHQNAFFWLWLLVASGIGFIALCLSTRNRWTRRMQTALVMSVFLHMILAKVLHENALSVMVSERPKSTKKVEPLPTLPDYYIPAPHSREEMAFQQPVETGSARQVTETAHRQNATANLEAPQRIQAEREAVQAVTSPAEIARQQPSAPRRAEQLSMLSRQTETSASLATGRISAPHESVGESPKQRLDAPRANASRRQPQKPRPVRRRDSPSDEKVIAAAQTARTSRASARPSDAAESESEMQRQTAMGELARTTARDISSQSSRNRASQADASVGSLSSPLPRLARARPTRTQTRAPTSRSANRPSGRRVEASTAGAGPTRPSRRTASTQNERQSAPKSPAASRSTATLNATQARSPTPSQVAAHASPDNGTSAPPIASLSRSSTQIPISRGGAQRSATTAHSRDMQPTVPSPQLERASTSSTAGENSLETADPGALASASSRRQSRAELTETMSGAGEIESPTNVGSSVEASSMGSANLSGPTSGGLQRVASRIPTRNRARRGVGGLSTTASAEAGLPNRRSSNQSLITHDSPQRFLQKPSQSTARISAAARDIAPAFAKRIARRNDPTRRGEGHNSPEVEATIERGLAYLASVQLPDGRWSLQHVGRPPGETDGSVFQAVIRADTAATGLSLLSFLGGGYDHLDEEYSQNVRDGLNFLLARQKANGDLYMQQSGPANEGVWYYSHGIAAIALCEAFGMTGDEKLREPAQRALTFIVETQEPNRGGWRYQPGKLSDLSVSGWQLMALRSGQLAGLKVPQIAMDRTAKLLDRAQVSPDNASEYVYNPWGNNTDRGRFGPQPNTVMTAVGLLMRLYSGWSRDHEAIRRGADRLLERLPEMEQPPSYSGTKNPLRDTYYWYNATQVMFHMQGEHWQRWQNRLYPMLAATQVQQGDLVGSWDPRKPVVDRWAASAGRIYLTTMNLLSLEVYHRHLPLFDTGLAVPSPGP